jgi:hypothetical protein
MSVIDSFELKRKLEGLRCPEHNDHPKVSVRGDTLKITACCESFKRTVSGKYKELLAEAGRKHLVDEFNKILKK